jgi:tetratricopeptide (TPR) repeat protein
MRNDTPYYMHKVECPVCKAINEFETIKVGAYEESGRDTDFRPTGINWKNPKYQRFNPILFFMATCSNCYFTREYTSKFRDWKSDYAFRSYRLKPMKSQHVILLAKDDSIVRSLGESLDSQSYPLQTAINKLLLGIFDELLSNKPTNLDIARYFLRIGWLFRESTSGESAMQNTVLSYASNVEDRVRGLGIVYDSLDKARLSLKPSLNDLVEQSSQAAKPVAKEIRNGCHQALAFLAGASEQLESAISTLKKTVQISSESADGISEGEATAASFAGQESYTEFLSNLRESWELVPMSEHDALRFALQFYKKSYETGHEVSAGNQQIQVEYLLGELCRRLGRTDEARQYFNKTIKSAQKFIYQHKGDPTRTALARKILEMALAQGKLNLSEAK